MQAGNDKRVRQRVLVFPCGSEVGLEIHRALSYSAHVELFGASSVASNHGPYVFHHYAEGLPDVDDSRFVAEIARQAQSWDIDFIFPAHDSVVLKLAQHQEELPCPVVTSPVATCEVCRNKRTTYARFRDVVSTPVVFRHDEPGLSFPVFLKPEVGQSSRGVALAETPGELDFWLARNPRLLLLEYLPGPEYTIDCFTDRHGALRFAGARERLRIQNGISVDTHPVPGDEFQAMAQRINDTLVFRGAWFFQVKRRADGELVLMEIAPRISGGMGLYRNLGVNFALLSVFDRMGRDVHVAAQSHDLRMDRALINRFHLGLTYRQVYIDLDDTLLVDGQVNTLAAAFLFQCRNRGVKVHLVSRHTGDIDETLARHGLTGVFDSVTGLDRLTDKSARMDAREAIFIDDSFAERRQVQEALGIPTFAVDALECLLDWRD